MAAEAAAVETASATNVSAANMLANSMQDLHDAEDDEDDDEGGANDESSRPPRHTAVLDGNAYDRKMGLCVDKGMKAAGANAAPGRFKGKRLGWSPDQVQVIDDDCDEDCVVVVEDALGECEPSANDAPGPHIRAPPPRETEVPKLVPKGILKRPRSGSGPREVGGDKEKPPPATARAPLPPPASALPSSSASARPTAALHKPCFEFAQTGQCRRGGVAPCVRVCVRACVHACEHVCVRARACMHACVRVPLRRCLLGRCMSAMRMGAARDALRLCSSTPPPSASLTTNAPIPTPPYTAGCRFEHAVAPCIANPEKYTRYDISWDDEEDRGSCFWDGGGLLDSRVEELVLLCLVCVCICVCVCMCVLVRASSACVCACARACARACVLSLPPPPSQLPSHTHTHTHTHAHRGQQGSSHGDASPPACQGRLV